MLGCFLSQCMCFWIIVCLVIISLVGICIMQASSVIHSDQSDHLKNQYQCQLQKLVNADVDNLVQLKAKSILDRR